MPTVPLLRNAEMVDLIMGWNPDETLYPIRDRWIANQLAALEPTPPSPPIGRPVVTALGEVVLAHVAEVVGLAQVVGFGEPELGADGATIIYGEASDGDATSDASDGEGMDASPDGEQPGSSVESCARDP